MKSETITVRFKINETPHVRKAARVEGQSVSAYIRSCTMEDFRTLCTPSRKARKMVDAMMRIATTVERMEKKEMGAGCHPVPPTNGATSTPPTPQRGRKARDRGTA